MRWRGEGTSVASSWGWQQTRCRSRWTGLIGETAESGNRKLITREQLGVRLRPKKARPPLPGNPNEPKEHSQTGQLEITTAKTR